MDKKEKQSGRQFCLVSLVSIFLACTALGFAIYTYTELSNKIREHDKLLQTMQINMAENVKVGDSLFLHAFDSLIGKGFVFATRLF